MHTIHMYYIFLVTNSYSKYSYGSDYNLPPQLKVAQLFESTEIARKKLKI